MARRSAALVVTGLATLAVAVSGSVGAARAPAALADPTQVHFTAAGDFGATTNTRAVLSTIAQLDPDLHLALGDLSYAATGAEQAWCDLVTGYVGAGFPFELVAGNHESDGLNGNINDFSACLPNQLPGVVGTYGRQWYVDVPEQNPLVRFVMISPGITFPEGLADYTAGSPRYLWTEAAIDGARAAAIPWVVVGQHKPCLSTGVYTCESGADLMNLMVSKKVDLVLQGHEHAYERTHQVATSAACPALVPGSFTAACLVDQDATMVRGAGTVFATVGTGGISQRATNPADAEHAYFATSFGLVSGATTWGTLDLRATATTLTADFVRSSGGSYDDAFTIAPADPTVNVAPTAAIGVGCAGLSCSFDASGSTDPDGTITGHTWAFGDGATSTQPAPEHTYATGGTYQVTLTVTDDDGATGSATRSVTVGLAPPFAADTFTRTVTNGLGTADTGGTWRTTGSTSAYAVTGSTARVTLAAAGSGPDISLPVSRASTDMTVSFATDKTATGGGLYVSVGARRVANVGEYRTKLHLRNDGTVAMTLLRMVGKSTEVVLAPTSVVPGLSYTSGTQLTVRTQVTGTNPTTVQARVWPTGQPEPTTWHLSTTDATAGLQVAGTIGINFYLSSSSTAAPLRVTLDDLVARAP